MSWVSLCAKMVVVVMVGGRVSALENPVWPLPLQIECVPPGRAGPATLASGWEFFLDANVKRSLLHTNVNVHNHTTTQPHILPSIHASLPPCTHNGATSLAWAQLPISLTPFPVPCFSMAVIPWCLQLFNATLSYFNH
jgi:hypothetical protein